MSEGSGKRRLRRRVRDAVMGRGYIRGIEAISAIGKRAPMFDPRRHGVRVVRDLAYIDDGDPAHHLDVWTPINRVGRLPVVIYVHGGAFHYLSKDTHWLMPLYWARRGFVVFNVNYRLAPKHPFPAALEDVARATSWAVRHAREFGGDETRLGFAGESAGGNLVTSLTLACCFDREEPYARELQALGVRPRAVLPACAVLQVSDQARLYGGRNWPSWVVGQLKEIEDGYLAPSRADEKERELADPLLVLEGDVAPVHALPPFFTIAGTRDPVLPDSERLHAALEARGVDSELRVYPGEIHAFHAMIHRIASRDAWRGQIAFTQRHL